MLAHWNLNPTCLPISPRPHIQLCLPVAVPGIFLAAETAASSADRGHSLRSLAPPPAALPSLPNFTTPAYLTVSPCCGIQHPQVATTFYHSLRPLSTDSLPQMARYICPQNHKICHFLPHLVPYFVLFPLTFPHCAGTIDLV